MNKELAQQNTLLHYKPLEDKPHFHPAPEQQHNPEDMLLLVSGTENTLSSCSLVLSAVGITHTCNHSCQEIMVRGLDFSRAQEQLQDYYAENENWPPPPLPQIDQVRSPGNPPTFIIMSMLALFFWATGEWSNTNIWFVRGAVDSDAIIHGEQWWRLVTGLTLHADIVHLVGNCFIGGFLVHLLCQITGYGLGWFLLILSGTCGNLLNILFRDQTHLSVGFSTAIFAAIGIFTGLRLRGLSSRHLKEMLVPLGAGAGLLAFLGTEGVRTDIGAHFSGFICGIALGGIVRITHLIRDSDSPFLQRVLFSSTLIMIFFCWRLALSGNILSH